MSVEERRRERERKQIKSDVLINQQKQIHPTMKTLFSLPPIYSSSTIKVFNFSHSFRVVRHPSVEDVDHSGCQVNFRFRALEEKREEVREQTVKSKGHKLDRLKCLAHCIVINSNPSKLSDLKNC